MASIVRVVVPVDGMDPESWKLALGYACAVAAHSVPPTQDIVLLTHTKKQMEGTSLSGHLGDRDTKALLAGSSVSIAGGMKLRHGTMRSVGNSFKNAVIIAFYADEQLLRFADSAADVKGVIAVPEGDIANWTSQWTPVVHGQAPSTPEVLIDDPVIEKALMELTRLGSGKAVLDPRDEARVNETLRILRAKGHTLLPEKIEAWAIRNGWKTKAASQLAQKAAQIGKLVGKPPLGAFHNPDGKYANWQI